MNTARDLARAATEAGLPQRLKSVELTAKITRSKKYGAGITATIPAWVKPSIGAEAGMSHQDDNTIRMIFEEKPADSVERRLPRSVAPLTPPPRVGRGVSWRSGVAPIATP